MVGESGAHTGTYARAGSIKFDAGTIKFEEMDQTQNGNIEYGAMNLDSKMSKYNAHATGYATDQ